MLLERLEDFPLAYDGFHDMIPFRVRGQLPADREKMCAKLREEIAELEAAPENIRIAYV